MYSRSYYADEANRVTLPDNYDGTAFREHENETTIETTPTEDNMERSVETSGNVGASGGVKMPILSSLFGTGGSGLSVPMNLGIEEILILATAAFLFFSKDGDKESAIILLLLLLIN
jgi:hypothetical protein